MIQCSSDQNRPNECRVDGLIQDARLSRQLSRSQCVEGRSWGVRGNGLWVTDGCRGEFRVRLARRGGGFPPRPRVDSIRCGSRNFGYNSCAANGFLVNLEIDRQLSGSACVAGRTFGYTGSTIWVDRGCEAVFRAYYR